MNSDAPTAAASRAPLPFLRSSVVRYAVVGGLSFAADATVLVVLREVAGVALLVAATFAFCAGLAVNFGLNHLWAFAGRSGAPGAFGRYLILVGANYVLTVAILAASREVGVHYTVAKVVAACSALCWNYVAYRFWVFR